MSSPPTETHVEALADNAWLVQLCGRSGHGIDIGTMQRVHALAARLKQSPPDWLLDLVPAYSSLGVFFDPERTTPDAALEWLHEQLQRPLDTVQIDDRRSIEIPVVYGGGHGPDLAEAARTLGLDETRLIERHAGGDYTVAMIGFAPGFPYLAGLDPALALSRLATPRLRVPAGSVAIGGAQTGIYPRENPGGWHVLGRTPLRLFDPGRGIPALLQPGDRVRFIPIGADEFERYGRDTA